MSTEHQVKIEMTGHGRGRVLLDGVELRHVKSVALKFEAGGTNVVCLELHASKIEIDGVASVEKVADAFYRSDWVEVNAAAEAELDALVSGRHGCQFSRPAGMTDEQVRAQYLGLASPSKDDQVTGVDITRVCPTRYVVDEAPEPERDPDRVAAVEAMSEKLKQLGE